MKNDFLFYYIARYIGEIQNYQKGAIVVQWLSEKGKDSSPDTVPTSIMTFLISR